MNVVRYAERPDLRDICFETLSRPTVPEYMHHNVPGNLHWGRLYEDFPDCQLALLDDGERRAAGSLGLRELDAPVRPTRKSLYPLIPIERCVEWRRGDGDHVFPGGLAPLHVRDGIGRHVEPNVWLRHEPLRG